MGDCASEAYQQSLRKYHNFIVKGVFAVALKAVPSRADFTKALGGPDSDEASVMEEVKVYQEAVWTG